MSNEKYTEDHEWLRLDDDGNITVGITAYAQEQLGDVVYVELPDAGTSFETNSRLLDEPELVNADPMGEGWFLRIIPEHAEDLDKLMDESEYNEYIGNL